MAKYRPGTVMDGFIVLEPGKYDFEVLDAVNKTAKSGNEMIELKLKSQGATYFDRLVFSEKSLWKINQFRRAIGQEIEEGEDEIDFDASDCLGQTGQVMLTVATFDGKRKNEVSEYLPDTGEI